LRFDKGTGRAPTFLLKFEPGATYPAHDHPAGEEVFVLEGEVTFGEHHLKAGYYMYTPLDRKHSVWSKQGCVMWLWVLEEVVILKNTHT
jgi:anti-sigma factor ChrR (cupin superfamily)